MKVVLFCGGLGTRLREHSDTTPKPLVNIGYRPILWHLMRYYAHYGHKEFILCLGYRGDMIKEFFLSYNECLSNDFSLSQGGKQIDFVNKDLDDWRITFVETGLHSNIGDRLLRVKSYVQDDEMFLANYADGLTDLNLHRFVEKCLEANKVGGFLSVRTPHSFHAVHADDEGLVKDFGRINESEFWVNAGFFMFKREIFNYLNPGEELVEAPFNRLIGEQQLYSLRYHGFWKNMDTLKDKISFDRMYARSEAPWEVWKKETKT